MLGGGVIATMPLTTLGTIGPGGIWVTIGTAVGAGVINTALFIGAFRILTAKVIATPRLLPGAVTGGLCYTLLQYLGTFLVVHYVRGDTAYGIFAAVLGLIGWIYLAVRITVYAAELNVVLARRLWPRSILQPPLTLADLVSLALQATQNRRRPEQHVKVTFDETGDAAKAPPPSPKFPQSPQSPPKRPAA
jgi:uncharacterized BrkB/YihY/UPF0761 family membrane protein